MTEINFQQFSAGGAGGVIKASPSIQDRSPSVKNMHHLSIKNYVNVIFLSKP